MRALALLALLTGPAFAQDTDLELVLLADASGSITQRELMFQRQSYARAMTDPDVLAAIANTAYGHIAVTYVEWATTQGVIVPWMQIDGPDSAAAFAAALDGPPRGATGRNAIGSALLFARDLIEQNRIDGWRRVIDFSGDTTGNTYGPPIEVARDEVLESNITINALAIVTDRPWEDASLAQQYEARIIGGPGAFVVEAAQGGVFAEAVKRKLILEISGLPTRRIVADLGD
ncbi:DUF1194 domain-containing protein [Jannaschia sp. M317]|uniref:DUF1194 domain-containing protein n=1 Tax=Jannaschia sp. M317 TaxID=2867011 RepID=UPI0021A6B46C|nr:DUF1194 domain-containing protein [Jannaschia sp. M317]UWQ17100.1 DUF1194 domain-containing protein [Jannaschia sp. M317]